MMKAPEKKHMQMERKLFIADELLKTIQTEAFKPKDPMRFFREKPFTRVVEDGIVVAIDWKSRIIDRKTEPKCFQLIVSRIHCCTLWEEENIINGVEDDSIVPQGIVTDVLSLLLLRLKDLPILAEKGVLKQVITLESILSRDWMDALFRRGWVYQFDSRNECMDLKIESVRAMTNYPEYRDLIRTAPAQLTRNDALDYHMADIVRVFRSTIGGRTADPAEIAKFLAKVAKVEMETALAAVASYDEPQPAEDFDY
jgi:hypothetical protein